MALLSKQDKEKQIQWKQPIKIKHGSLMQKNVSAIFDLSIKSIAPTRLGSNIFNRHN